MEKNKKIKLRNRAAGKIIYRIPDLNNCRREFEANETKTVTFEEIEKLSYDKGGRYLLNHYLVIDDIAARDEIMGHVELEYDWTEREIKNMLIHGSTDQLLDCLDFAPLGVISLVKEMAVKLELNDIRKRQIIQEKLGFNISNAIEFNKETNEQTSSNDGAMHVRRVQVNAGAENAEKKPTYRRVDAK